MLINGEFTQGKAKEKLAVINPATEEIIREVWRGTAADVDAAVKAAHDAFPAWRKTPGMEKAALLHQAAAKMRAHHDELVRLLTQEEGKPLCEHDEEMFWVEDTHDYYAEFARHHRGQVIPPGNPDQFNFVVEEPWGVVGCIVPWNYPLLLLAWKLAPALAAGNTVVIKPSQYTPISTLKLVEVAFDEFPPGVVNVVTGTGGEIGEAIVRHPQVRMIAVTGSLEVGQHIASVAAPMMKKMHLELGGKDPMVIAQDVDIPMAVSALSYAALINAGQVCTSTERVYVHDSIYSRFIEELADFVSKLRLGNGLDVGTDIGPMLRDKFRRSVDAQVKQAVKAGAKLVYGGEIPNEFEKGFFYKPTILADVNHSMQMMIDETFGPVIPLMPYKDFDEAIRLANDNQFGLGASLLTHDARLVKRFFEEVEAGTVWINDPLTDNFAGPFGGMKMSGIGRELGQAGWEEFVQVKHVHWDVVGEVKDFWYPY
jgi:acyl-CoA reductase-like NAD-dependent aldehyde dehydrogenase